MFLVPSAVRLCPNGKCNFWKYPLCWPPSQGSFDTFGSGGAEAARMQAQREAEARPSLIPGPILDEVVVPVADSTGEGGKKER
eukprot:scaffold127360_cov26-Tisochrysis_lutea.AAC.1